MELWVLITVGAAFLQNIRSALQKHLKGRIGTSGSTFIRFGFGLPFALLYMAIIHYGYGHILPSFNLSFVIWVLVAAISQITAQALLIMMFDYKNFTVGTAYSRTEPMQAALFGLVFLTEAISLGIIAAITISVIGVMLISVARTELTLSGLRSSFFSRVTIIGLGSGSLFGLAAVAYRGASLSLADTLEKPDFLIQASLTLCVAIFLQSIIMAVYIAIKSPAEFVNITKAWKPSLAVGFVGATASFGWFSAMTLEKAALVKTVAQIEILFTFATMVFIFKEKITRLEVIGCSAIIIGIIGLYVA